MVPKTKNLYKAVKTSSESVWIRITEKKAIVTSKEG
jgi:hypothetical protein